MKYILIFYSLVPCFFLHLDLYAQRATEITGTVKAKQGAVQGAQIQFYDQGNEFQGNCISGSNGKFISEKKMAVDRTFRLVINADGFKPLEKSVRVNASGEAGEFMLERKELIVTGFVRDSITEEALTGVEIFFYDGQGRLVQAGSTNSMGYYQVEASFNYGEKITVRAAKKGFHDDKEQTLTFTSQGINRQPDVLLPPIGARGLRAFIQVRDKRTGQPIGGGTVRYFDKQQSKYVNAPVPDNGNVELKLYQSPGTALDLEVVKPKYRPFALKTTLSERPLDNVFTCDLVKGK